MAAMRSSCRLHVLLLLLLLVLIRRGANTFILHANNNRRVKQSRHLKQRPASLHLDLSKTPSPNDDDDEETTQLDSLDVILDRARKRNQIPLLIGKWHAVLDRRVLPFLSIGDVLIVLAALFLVDAKGFAIGLVIGKASLTPIRRILQEQDGGSTSVAEVTRFLDFYPALLAILLDQVL